jgi:hypothetical protein
MKINATAFYTYAFSDYLDNVVRGALGEYIVATALGVTDAPLSSWQAWDITYQGIKIEVKTSAYIQTWKQKKLTPPKFGIPAKQLWSEDTGKYDGETKRHADVYVFCLYTETDIKKAREHILNTDYWQFYVVSTQRLPKQKTIGLSSLELLTKQIGFAELATEIDKLAQT